MLDEIIAELDRASGQGGGPVDRAERRPVNRPAVIIQSPIGEVGTRHEVYVRNVSRSGSAVLHTAFLQPQHPCVLVFVNEQHESVTVEASVVRCEHVSGQLHDVAVRFKRELTDEEAEGLSIAPGSAKSMMDIPPMQLAETVAKCKVLASQVYDLMESGAPAEKVLPMLDQLRSIEPGRHNAA